MPINVNFSDCCFEDLVSLTMQRYGKRLSENFHASSTVVLVTNLTVKFLGTSGRTNADRNKKKKREKQTAALVKMTRDNEEKNKEISESVREREKETGSLYS